jgi:hypothetical protein
MRNGALQRVGSIAREVLDVHVRPRTLDESLTRPQPPSRAAADDTGRYDFDLAEFPLFRYAKRAQASRDSAPLTYSDTITGKNGQEVRREWKCYAGAFGFGGATTQQVLYELLQLYISQGCRGSQIQFGTPRALLLQIWPDARNPSLKDYTRLRRDLDILRGYDFHCRNAFWDRTRQAYVDMHWRLFGDVCYFRPRSDGDAQQELPFGFIEASSVLQQIARMRGFFCLGFSSALFHSLKPLEQRLAVYLSKKFVSQVVHQRYVADLGRAIPIEASRPDNVRTRLGQAAQGLLDRGVPTLKRYGFEKSRRTGEWVIVFERNVRPKQSARMPKRGALCLDPEVELLVNEIAQQIGSRDDVLWWTKCAEVLGPDLVYQGLSQFRDARNSLRIRSPGAFLTRIFKDLARLHGLSME